MLFHIMIEPIEFILRIIFYTCYGVTYNIVLSLIGLSLGVSFLTLPLYNRADAYQKQERDKQHAMEKGISTIRKAFKGDERYWVLSAYYKEQGYKTIYVLRSSLSLLLQIPFFIAAYHFLSNMIAISDKLFVQADQWLQIGNYSINVLPILMTVINLLSGMVYSKDLKWKEKWQIYALPIIFLVILYNSPAALVIYWIFNNVFSLVKNLVIRYKMIGQMKKVCQWLGYGIGALAFMLIVYIGCQQSVLTVEQEPLVMVCLFLLYNVPLIVLLFFKEKGFRIIWEKHQRTVTFKDVLMRELVLFIMWGIYIPSSVIVASPAEFLRNSAADMMAVLQYTFLACAGLFFIWFNIVYFFLEKKHRYIYCLFLTGSICLALYNYFFWGTHNGLLKTNLQYEDVLQYDWHQILISIGCFILAVGLIFFVFYRFSWMEKALIPIAVISLSAVSGWHIYSINNEMKAESIQADKIKSVESVKDEGVFHFSRNGKNVVIIMLDRAIGAYVPYIVEERPDLKEAFAGFTFYPNAVSMGKFTVFGSAEIFGGYEYTPAAMDARKDELLRNKHNEALKVLPEIFGEAGYRVSLADLPYANYTWTGDMSVFDEYEYVQAYQLEKIYASDCYENQVNWEEQGRSFLEYSFFKTSPFFLQHFIYYYVNNQVERVRKPLNVAFYAPYRILSELTDLTKVDSSDTDYFMELDNNMTHEPCELQLPDYIYPESRIIDNSDYDLAGVHISGGRVMKMDTRNQIVHYHVNVAALELLGKWFDYLREMGVYDNTRIIIVSDHGRQLNQFEDMLLNEDIDVQAVNCLMLYKDFNSRDWNVSDEFMTNADVPTLAVQDLIPGAINPFTGNKVDSARKFEGPMEITLSEHIKLSQGTVFDTSDAPWYSVHDNIFMKENWKKIKD